MAVPSITNATNATPIVVTTSGAHGFANGDTVTVASVGGNTNANGTWRISVLSSTTFSISAYGNAAYTSGGTATKVTVDPANVPGAMKIAKETTTTTGTGDVTLGGAVSGFSTVASLFSDQEEGYYRIAAVDGGGNETGVFETGVGAFNAGTDTFSRSSVGSNNSGGTTAVDFGAGSKIITVESSAYDSTPQQAELAATAVVTSLTFPNEGRLRCIKAIGMAEGRSSIAYLVPTVDNTANSGVFCKVSLRLIRQNTWWNGTFLPNVSPFTLFNQAINIEFWPGAIRAAGFVDYPSVDVSQASPIPFTYDPTTLPDQNGTKANLPADFFIYVPIYTGSTPPRPRIFYLNWATQQARYTNLVGHDIVFSNSRGYWGLDTSKATDAPMTITGPLASTYAAYTSYFRYIGTAAGDANGQLINLKSQRYVHSAANRLPYVDDQRDASPLWDVITGWGGSLMHPAAPTPWRHFWVNGIAQQGSSNLHYAKCTGYGKLQMSMALNSVGDLLKTIGPDTDAGLTASPQRSIAQGQLAVTGYPAQPGTVDEYEIRAASLTSAQQDVTQGLNVVNVIQFAVQANGVNTYRFFGDGQPIRLGDPTIVFAGPVVTAGQAYFRTIGDC